MKLHSSQQDVCIHVPNIKTSASQVRMEGSLTYQSDRNHQYVTDGAWRVWDSINSWYASASRPVRGYELRVGMTLLKPKTSRYVSSGFHSRWDMNPHYLQGINPDRYSGVRWPGQSRSSRERASWDSHFMEEGEESRRSCER